MSKDNVSEFQLNWPSTGKLVWFLSYQKNNQNKPKRSKSQKSERWNEKLDKMSERKVLNKYYPPDFDPSKIPRNKDGPRNKTFIIRLMAPCNMRCTTCGEYIYKGRKFNSRKEDVDDMNHLGLRIYRYLWNLLKYFYLTKYLIIHI